MIFAFLPFIFCLNAVLIKKKDCAKSITFLMTGVTSKIRK